jgi:iron-sulfur cluster assembly protein
MIHISAEALGHMRQLIEGQQDPEIKGIRLSVMAGGCSGMSYSLDFEKEPELDDNVFGGDPPVYVDSASLGFIDGLSLRFTGGLNGKGLIFDNPKAVDTCGCGTSFALQR